MKLTEINPEKTPELFFMPRIDGGNTIYDQVAEDTSAVNTDCLRSLKKKVHDGEAEFKMYSEHIELLWNDVLVSKAELIGSVFINSAWVQKTFDFELAEITKVGDGEFNIIITTDNVIFGLKWTFARGIETKQTFYIDSPDRLVRIRWHVETDDNALAENREDERGLRYSVDDYAGNVDYYTEVHTTTDWTNHYWDFEPDGILCDSLDTRDRNQRFQDAAGLKVDPYLTVDEQATYTNVVCDGYLISFKDYAGTSTLCVIQDTAASNLLVISPLVHDGSNIYYISYDSAFTWTILENTPTRVILRLKGSFVRNTLTPLAGDDYSTFDFIIYPDRLIINQTWYTDGVVSIGTNYYGNGFNCIDYGSITNRTNFYENSGVETSFGSSGQYASADYIAISSDEMNIQKINILNDKESGTATFTQGCDGSTILTSSWINGTIGTAATNEVHKFSSVFVIDSVERETITPALPWSDTNYSVGNRVSYIVLYECISAVTSGNSAVTKPGTGSDWETYWVQSHGYTVDERLEQGDQYKDYVMALTDGTAVTTGTGMTAIGTGGFASDGAWHIEPDSSDEIKYTLDRTRHKMVDVIHDFPYTSGDGAVDYLTFQWDCETTAVEVGGKTMTLDGATLIAEPNRGNVLYCDATYHDNAHCTVSSEDIIQVAAGTLIIEVLRPAVSGDTFFYCTGQTGSLHLESSSGNLVARIGSSTLTWTSVMPEIEIWYSVIFTWDNTTNLACLNINGVNYAAKSFTGLSGSVTELQFGGDYASPNIKLNNIKILDEPIFNHGAYFTGNTAAQLSAGLYHKDILFYWNAESADSIIPTTPITGTWGSSSSASDLVSTAPINGKYYDVGSTDNNHWIKFTGDIATPEQGSISFWMNLQVFATTDGIFYLGWDADNHIMVSLNDTETDKVGLRVNLGGTYEYTDIYDTAYNVLPDLLNDGWIHWQFTWKEAEFIRIYVNGIFSTEETTVGTADTGLGNPDLYISSNDSSGQYGADMWIDEFYITNNPNTPQIPTANGVPLDVPLLDKS